MRVVKRPKILSTEGFGKDEAVIFQAELSSPFYSMDWPIISARVQFLSRSNSSNQNNEKKSIGKDLFLGRISEKI